MTNLPPVFVENMKKQLPVDEWEAFFAVYGQKPYKGVRINPLKGEPTAIAQRLPFLGERVAWEKNGFYTQAEKIGATVYHHAGLVYSQEPSAMCAAPLLDVQPGERVLDLCSAPGGKGTRLAADLQGEGLIVLNEPISARAKILSQNVERLGITNAVVTCEYPQTLAARFQGYFDKIMVDAPCSGEGMFRKNAEEALSEWSEENIALCARRQAEILAYATQMLSDKGRLVYSTCTFSQAEDEGQVCDYLQKHPYMQLVKEEKIYPHRQKGEGHYAALFQRDGAGNKQIIRPIKPYLSAASEQAFLQFARDFFKHKFTGVLHEVNGVLYQLPRGVFDWKGLNVLRVGVRLGEVKNGRFTPCHALAMSMKADECTAVVSLTDEKRIEGYLRGETLPTQQRDGWCLVCAYGYPVGLGKAVGGTLKNHLPKGLRKF